jgi:hypothetical protein
MLRASALVTMAWKKDMYEAEVCLQEFRAYQKSTTAVPRSVRRDLKK